MILSNAWNRAVYRLSAPIYDWLAVPFERGRKRAIERLEIASGERVLIVGCGTGLDLEYLPAGADVVAVDLAPGMIEQAEARARRLDREVDARVADARSLDLPDGSVDAILLHLVLSVVPNPEELLGEAARVLAADGRASILAERGQVEAPTAGNRGSLEKPLESMLSETDFATGEDEAFDEGGYAVTVARPP